MVKTSKSKGSEKEKATKKLILHTRESRRMTTRRARRAHQRHLKASSRFDSELQYACTQQIASNNQRLLKEYGFIANPNLTVNENVNKIINENPNWFETSLPDNLTFHNLCTFLDPPNGLRIVLGLGEKFCIEKEYPKPPIKNSIHRLIQDVRIKQWSKTAQEPEGPKPFYIPGLYVKSDTKFGSGPGPNFVSLFT